MDAPALKLPHRALTRPAVLGGGSWGTALALVLARRGLPVNLWVHDGALAARMSETRVNDVYLAEYALPPEVAVHADLEESVRGADCVIFAVPSAAMRTVAEGARPFLAAGTCLVSTAKGIEENTLYRMSEVLRQVYPGCGVAVLSGPSFAHEVAAAHPAAVVVASEAAALREAVQALFSGPAFRVYLSGDVVGVEIGGATKNVIAIAAGICDGLKVGHNAVAALITRGLAEMSRLALRLGGEPRTLAGLSGLGDLVLTCTGFSSRNRRAGVRLAEGVPLEQLAVGRNSRAEGLGNASSLLQLAYRERVDLPIVEQMNEVLAGRVSPRNAIQNLMERSLREE